MFTIRRRLLAVTALAILAIAMVVPASADYDSYDAGGCYGWGATNRYSASVASATYETSGYNCWIYLQARALVSGSWYTYFWDSGWESPQHYDVYYGAGVPGWATHLLGPDDWTVDGGDTVD